MILFFWVENFYHFRNLITDHLYKTRILKKYLKKTGELAIINTSFNRHEEPIVQDINDALSVLDSNIIKTLVFENYFIKKNHLFVNKINIKYLIIGLIKTNFFLNSKFF